MVIQQLEKQLKMRWQYNNQKNKQKRTGNQNGCNQKKVDISVTTNKAVMARTIAKANLQANKAVMGRKKIGIAI